MAARRSGSLRLVTVCDKCFRAICWFGIEMCDGSRNAGTIEKTVGELRKLKLEHPNNYSVDTIRQQCGTEPRYAEVST